MRGARAGFSLIETLIATALFVVVAFGALESLRVLLPAVRQLAARHLAYAGVERLTAQLRAEARSAVAVWPSAPAKSGAHDDCDELSFYTADAAGPKFWSYRRFPNHAAGEPVPAGVLLRVTGSSQPPPCDPTAVAQAILSGVTAFSVSRVAAPQLAAHADPYDGAADGGFITGALDDDAVPVGVLDAGGAPVHGGNALVEVRLDTGDASRAVDLVAGVAPGGFTTVLSYTCTARCAVGHGAANAQTLTNCNAVWQTASGWPVAVYGPGYYLNSGEYVPQGPLWGYAWDGFFVVTYYDSLFGRPDRLTRTYEVTNWPPGGWSGGGHLAYPSFPAGLNAGALADARTWLNDIAYDLLPGQSAPVQSELSTCAALSSTAQTQGINAYLRNL